MEQYLRDKIFPIGTKIFYFPPIIICCVNIILVIIVGFMLTSILRKIPIIRKSHLRMSDKIMKREYVITVQGALAAAGAF